MVMEMAIKTRNFTPFALPLGFAPPFPLVPDVTGVESVTSICGVVSADWVGVPDTEPDEDRFSPTGKDPEATFHV